MPYRPKRVVHYHGYVPGEGPQTEDGILLADQAQKLVDEYGHMRAQRQYHLAQVHVQRMMLLTSSMNATVTRMLLS